MIDKQEVFVLYKKLGETPLECLERFRSTRVDFADLPMTYAGRLDPMAEGVLLVLVGEMCKQKEKYTTLPKGYEFEILFGVTSDTGDVLGLIGGSCRPREYGDPVSLISEEQIIKILPQFLGKFEQTYPVYSSKTVSGKPLWSLAREGKLYETEIPKREVEVFDLRLNGATSITGAEVLREVERKIAFVSGDFRQKEIIQNWQDFLKDKDGQLFQIAKLTVSCGSGLYVRTLSEKIAEKLGTVGLAWSIKRTRIGSFLASSL